MDVLISGGSGFLGRAVAARLLADGRSVWVLTRGGATLPTGAKALVWNPSGAETLALPEGLSAVVQLAGAGIAAWPWTKSRKETLWKSRVESTRRLVDAISRLRRKPAALVCASGMGYYGDSGERTVSAVDPPGGDFLGRMAKAWEDEAFSARALGLRVAVLRLGLVLDGEGGALPRMALPFRLGLGAVLGSGRQYWPWIHREDAAALVCRACDDAAWSGPLHGVAGAPVTQREFSRALAEALRRPLFLRAPETVLRLALGEMADLFLHGQKASGNAPDFTPRHDTLPRALKSIFAKFA